MQTTTPNTEAVRLVTQLCLVTGNLEGAEELVGLYYHILRNEVENGVLETCGGKAIEGGRRRSRDSSGGKISATAVRRRGRSSTIVGRGRGSSSRTTGRERGRSSRPAGRLPTADRHTHCYKYSTEKMQGLRMFVCKNKVCLGLHYYKYQN